MVKTRTVKDVTETIDLCEIYSTEGYKLKQIETEKIYGKSVIGILSGYDEDNQPYSRFTYEETDELDPTEEEEETNE